MIQKKVCMVGVAGTGKTSMVQRFVHSLFSERYLKDLMTKAGLTQVSTMSPAHVRGHDHGWTSFGLA